jgi:arylsulfatase
MCCIFGWCVAVPIAQPEPPIQKAASREKSKIMPAHGFDEFFGNLYNQYKLVFAEQRAHGFDVWSNPFTFLRFPKLFNLRADPFEHADEIDAMGYQRWRAERMFVLVPAQQFVAKFLSTFKEFPPRQKPASFSIDQVLDRLQPKSN